MIAPVLRFHICCTDTNPGEKTETALKISSTVAYPVHVVLFNLIKGYPFYSIDHGYTIVG